MKKILVFATSYLDKLATITSDENNSKELLLKAATENGWIVEFRCDRNPTAPLKPEELEGVSAVIADLEEWTPELLKQVSKNGGGNLGLIARYGIGYNSVAIETTVQEEIFVTNTPAASAQPTAEWTVATLLSTAGRRIPHHSQASKGLTKKGPSRLDIKGKTLGVVGTGTIGKEVVSLMQGFNLNVIAHDPYPDNTWAKNNNAVYTDLKELCTRADMITLHASGGTPIIGKEELSVMKPTTILVNCARGVLTDNSAVYEAVKNNKLFGFGFDEPWDYPDLPLTPELNICASPHVGSDSDYGKHMMKKLSTEAVIAFMNGQTPPYLIKGGVSK